MSELHVHESKIVNHQYLYCKHHLRRAMSELHVHIYNC